MPDIVYVQLPSHNPEINTQHNISKISEATINIKRIDALQFRLVQPLFLCIQELLDSQSRGSIRIPLSYERPEYAKKYLGLSLEENKILSPRN